MITNFTGYRNQKTIEQRLFFVFVIGASKNVKKVFITSKRRHLSGLIKFVGRYAIEQVIKMGMIK